MAGSENVSVKRIAKRCIVAVVNEVLGASWSGALDSCFFFQAEDGIRDYKVTGVQTCALPICQVEAMKQLEQARLRGSLGTLSGAEQNRLRRPALVLQARIGAASSSQRDAEQALDRKSVV